ncbi:hypothetical protein TNCT_188531 [Trichonephila clavata]|uniref:Uncharacterized protein n=1 Tax=Trichonephila clavata TaxID=2740835 RepID=A0A8X6GDB7_TRICU|nr:hypothetical protein TNCT_188531 [Trichonephila clavata]
MVPNHHQTNRHQTTEGSLCLLRYGASPQLHNDARRYLNKQITQLWIGLTGLYDKVLLKWPQSSPDMMP